MSSAGHVLDMLNRYRANRQLLPRKDRKKSLGQIRTIYKGEMKRGGDPMRETLSEIELASLRKTVILKIRSERIRGLIITWIIALVLIGVGIWIFISLIA